MSITMVIGAAVFQLFRQNERIFQDQNLITEMQQGARAAISQTADEIRMAGQGVPVYATSYDASPSEGAVAVLAGSSSTRINFRAGLSPAESAKRAGNRMSCWNDAARERPATASRTSPGCAFKSSSKPTKT